MIKRCLVGIAVLGLWGLQSAFGLSPQLSKIQSDIETKYDNVQHIDADTFSVIEQNDLVIFDVRRPAEFNVSHIQGAIQVDPKISARDFKEKYAGQLDGKVAVFYCSVGRRSSDLASRVADVVKSNGATASFNLIGGAFHWHNEARPLIKNESTQTPLIHPYNFYWGRLIANKKAISYKPE